jgi:hypothetical protein
MSRPEVPAPATSTGLFASVCALWLCGLTGACLILSQAGFTTSGKRGESPVFVPAPQAWVMAAIMFALSALALLWMLRALRVGGVTRLACFAAHAGVAIVLVPVLARIVH